jgi:hypothetical protein
MNCCLAFAFYAVGKVVMRYAPPAVSTMASEIRHVARVVQFDCPKLAIPQSAANAYPNHQHLI